MARLPVVSSDMVPEEFREAFGELTAATGGSITGGPGSFTINSPEMAKRRNHLTSYLRYETQFPKRILELAIITTARAMDCQYVWNAHAPAARKEGVADALVDAIRDRQPLPAMAPDEEAIVNYGNEFFKDHKISDATFNKALKEFGAQHLVELTTLMGHYAQTSFYLNAFEAELPDNVTERNNRGSDLLSITGNILRGEMLRSEGKLDEAIAVLELAVETHDGLEYAEPEALNFSARHWLGAALLEAGRYSDAERVYVGALEQHRHNGWSYFGLERALRAQDKISEADRIKAEFNRVWQRADIIIRSSRF